MTLPSLGGSRSSFLADSDTLEWSLKSLNTALNGDASIVHVNQFSGVPPVATPWIPIWRYRTPRNHEYCAHDRTSGESELCV